MSSMIIADSSCLKQLNRGYEVTFAVIISLTQNRTHLEIKHVLHLDHMTVNSLLLPIFIRVIKLQVKSKEHTYTGNKNLSQECIDKNLIII